VPRAIPSINIANRVSLWEGVYHEVALTTNDTALSEGVRRRCVEMGGSWTAGRRQGRQGGGLCVQGPPASQVGCLVLNALPRVSIIATQLKGCSLT
jgi:hypothetical protein